ncbi:MAG: hypothetical protein Q8P39_00960 [Candidatus Yanofskybacteria bacterium]|nr:hypothetical protein [Candidatus Yanofskybacteria bacterium]
MRFEIPLQNQNLPQIMRQCGYAPEGQDGDEWKFTRPLRGARYPRFHMYARTSPDAAKASLNLHLDQKQPSYRGSSAHSGEYDGPLVEQEAARIQSLVS